MNKEPSFKSLYDSDESQLDKQEIKEKLKKFQGTGLNEKKLKIIV